MRKILKVTANVDGWYSLKASCDEGTIITNIKLEAGKPLELSFVNNRLSIDRGNTQQNDKENKEQCGYKNFSKNRYTPKGRK